MRVEQQQSDILHRLCLLQEQNLMRIHNESRTITVRYTEQTLSIVRTESNEINKTHNESRTTPVRYTAQTFSMAKTESIIMSYTMRIDQPLSDALYVHTMSNQLYNEGRLTPVR